MVKGSCMCGDFTYEYTGEPGGNAICHCEPCRKSAGLNGSTNTFLPSDNYKQLTGSVKTWSRKGDSGKAVEYGFCPTCCTLMYVRPEAMAGMTIVKPGTIDDAGVTAHLNPGMEIYTKERVAWVKPTEGAQQKETS